MASMLAAVLAAPLVGAAIVGTMAIAAARTGRPASRPLAAGIACAAPLVSFALALALFAQLRALPAGSRTILAPLFDWLSTGALHVPCTLLLDPLSATMLLVVTGIGSLIHIYSIGYMAHDGGHTRYFAYLNLFVFFMLLLILGDSLPVLFVGWEGVGLCSYLLIGFWFEDEAKAAAGKKAFIVNRIGDLGFLLGIFLVFWTMAGGGHASLAFREIAAHRDLFAGGVATAVCLLLFVGACGKSAQIPLYVWLPDAMAGPTPVSALIHAATMVTAGVYMVARLGFLYEMAPAASAVVAIVGITTALLAATIALVETDIKKVLAYSTVSQLGYMFIGAGSGAYAAAIFHVVTHAFFKACLFLGAGSVIHGLHEEQDIRKMGGLRGPMRWTFITFFISTLAISGFPFLSGFFSKDAILAAALAHVNPAMPSLRYVVYALALAGAGLTAFYMMRLAILVFFGAPRSEKAHHAHESPAVMTAPLAILAAGAVFAGALGIPHALGGGDRIVGWLAESVTGGAAASAHSDALHETGSHSAAGEHAEGVAGDPPPDEHRAVGDHAGGEPAAHATAGHASSGAAHHSAATEIALMALSTLVALSGAGLAYLFYAKRPSLPAALASRAAGLYRVLRGRWYVDEIYSALIVRPLLALSDSILWRRIDTGIIDRTVNAVGRLAEGGSYLLRLTQSGQVQTYGLLMLIALAILTVKLL
jgi:NADH-quinone oxidoreductase subunit L